MPRPEIGEIWMSNKEPRDDALKDRLNQSGKINIAAIMAKGKQAMTTITENPGNVSGATLSRR